MLVKDSFIYLSLPRCASTSFHMTCVKNGIPLKHENPKFDVEYDIETVCKIPNTELVYKIKHVHETLNSLKIKFGNNYEVISVKRDRYERFLSYWNHCIGELYRNNEMFLYDTFRKLTIDDLMNYQSSDLISTDSINEIVKTFMKNLGYGKENRFIEKLIQGLVSPISTYHNDDPNIIWFDFEKLNELEEWVSNKLNRDFKLEKFGSSKMHSSNIIIDDKFIEKYDRIYDYYDLRKKTKTLI